MTTPAFREWVDRARGVHINAILQQRHIVLTGRGNNRAGPCPKCGGEDRFSVQIEKQVFNCRGCGGKGQGAISLVAFLDGTNFLQSVETINGEPAPKDEPKEKKPRGRKPRGTFVCAYPYTDELADEQFQVVRYREPKSFSQRRADPDHPGQWIENLSGVRLVPYRLPELIEGIAMGNPVYWCEGEKDADNGSLLGLVTTTTAMGTAGKGAWQRGAYDEFFRDADVILVPHQDADDSKGREFGRVIGQRLLGVASSVRVLTLPVKDLSDFIDAGNTRDDLETIPLAPFVAPNGHDLNGAKGVNGHAHEGLSDFTQHWQPPGEEDKPKPPIEIPLLYPFPLKAEHIPPRPWLVEGLLLRRHVSVLVAPPGSGKSLLTLQLALMMSTAKSWGGWRPRHKAKVLVINSEDDADEMKRRLYAAREVMGYDESLLVDHIAIADSPEDIIIARADSKTRTVVRTPMVENIVLTIKARAFDVVVIDPFAECFEGDENSNSELKWAAVLWREIARRSNCAVLLVHHTRKYGAEAGDMNSARGAGALVGVARVVSTLLPMTEREAERFEVNPEDRHQYLRFDDAKANLSLITLDAKWFQKKTLTLPNANDDEPADKVGALDPWRPKNVFDLLDAALARAILLAIDAGVIDDKTGKPTGDLFTLTKKGRTAKRWAGTVVQEHIEDCADRDAQKLLNVWHKNRVLIEVTQATSTSKGQPRKGLKVNMGKLPGTLISEEDISDKLREKKS